MARRRTTRKRRRRVGFSTKSPYWFDAETAAAYVEFLERFVHHVKGELAGEPFRLEEHERFQVEELFGWKRKDADRPEDCTRQYRTLYEEVPRKNNKSTKAAGLALAMLFIDREPGAEIYAAAADKDQARIVFETSKAMIELEPELSRRVTVFKDSIVHDESAGRFRVLSADAFTKHGLNVSGLIVDEVHVHPSRDLIDTLHTATGARRQPLEIYITTAGVYDRTTIAWELHQRAVDVIDEKLVDDSLLPFVFGAKETDDWRDVRVHRRANPMYGKSLKPEYIAAECERAKTTPGYQATFKRLHLNIWTSAASVWIDDLRWRKCRRDVTPDMLEGALCFAGLDLASTTDLAAFVLLFARDTGEIELREIMPQFPTRTAREQYLRGVAAGEIEPHKVEVARREYILRPYFWMPADNVAERTERDHVPYDVWARDGSIKTTPGDVIDYDVIRNDINAAGELYPIEEIGIDRWNATQLITQLTGDGFVMVPVGQGFASMGQPTRDFETFVKSRRIVHEAHPVLDWMLGNIQVEYDAAGYPKPSKGKSKEKIDGIVAAIMALGRAVLYQAPPPSVYESRGVRTIG